VTMKTFCESGLTAY